MALAQVSSRVTRIYIVSNDQEDDDDDDYDDDDDDGLIRVRNCIDFTSGSLLVGLPT